MSKQHKPSVRPHPARDTQTAISAEQAEDLKARLFGAHKSNPEATHAMAAIHKASERRDG